MAIPSFCRCKIYSLSSSATAPNIVSINLPVGVVVSIASFFDIIQFSCSQAQVSYYNQLISKGETVKMLFAVAGDFNDIYCSAVVQEIVSDKDLSNCPGEIASVPEEFGDEERAKIWIKITDIQREPNITASMLKVRSTGANLKQIISNSQFHFGYVYIPENED